MQTIYFCTSNEGKKKKLQNDFSELTDGIVLEIIDFEVNEIQDMDCEIVAKTKVMDVFAKIKKPCLAMDSGLYINSLKNFPGSYIKMALQTIGVQGIVKLLEDKTDRTFTVSNCLAYYDGKNLKIVSETLEGTIADTIYPKINNQYAWSQLNKILIPTGSTQTLAEMSDKQYQKRYKSTGQQHGISKKFIDWFEKKK